jgi:cell wall-associated NlpC family hydrolase
VLWKTSPHFGRFKDMRRRATGTLECARGRADEGLVRLLRPLILALAAISFSLAAIPSPAAATSATWANRQVRFIISTGLFPRIDTPSDFRAGDPLTAGTLARLTKPVPGPILPVPPDPTALVTVHQLNARFVHALALGDLATQVSTALTAAGLNPPAGTGTEVVARTLGFRPRHPRAPSVPAHFPNQVATRGEGAYTAWKVLTHGGWSPGYARSVLGGLYIPPVPAAVRPALRLAVSQIGAPYVWGGTSVYQGGFDCSGLVVYAEGGQIAPLGGRTTMDMARSTPRSERIAAADLQAGDLVFFGPNGAATKPGRVDHVGLVLGSGWFIDANGQGVTLDRLDAPWWASRLAFGKRPPQG